MKLKYLKDKWDASFVSNLDEPEILRYRSNLLGSDLRITNFGGGNTSSKIRQPDPVTDEEMEVLWVKGSGGDLGSITRDGFAQLYMERFLALKGRYRGPEYEDEMVEYYPICRFGLGGRPASIDTPLHGLLSFKHIDHLHPDWAIALAAAGNGKQKLEAFNREFGQNVVWLPWQRPGYHLGVMLEEAVQAHPDANGLILASHGTFTWGDSQYECYRNSIELVDALGRFVVREIEKSGDALFGGAKHQSLKDRNSLAAKIMPFLRGHVGEINPLIGHFSDSPDVLRFVNSRHAQELAYQGTSCPDHFIRTKVRPLYLDWDPEKGHLASFKEVAAEGIERYRKEYGNYYESLKEENSPEMRDPNPTVALVPGVGMFTFGKSKKEARITGEFYLNAIHVMEGATALEDGHVDEGVESDRAVHNYMALTPEEAFRIEYWALEEAKLRRQPPESEMSRRIAVVIGGGSGIGREFCYRLAGEGAHLVVADLDAKAAQETDVGVREKFGSDVSTSFSLDISDRDSVKEAFRAASLHFGGLDVLVNTAAMFLPPDKGDSFRDETWDRFLKTNISGNNIVVEEFAEIIAAQNSEGSVLLTSSANAVVPKVGSEPYDVSKAAVSHLIRELAIRYAPGIRINGISPATVFEGSRMFPRDRIIASLKKYGIEFDENEETAILREKLAGFYAQRTLTRKPIRPADVVEAGYFLISPRANRTTGHIIPVDGGLTEAFLR